MKITIGDYKIESDSKCFILKGKRIVQESKLTKEENIGKEAWSILGYYTTVDSLLGAIPKQILLDNDDLKTIIQKLGLINLQIKEIKKVLNEVIK